MRPVHLLALLVLLAFGATPALAERGGNGGGNGNNASAPSATCSVSDGVVAAVGLPTDEVINFMVTDEGGTTGWVLGSTDDGTWNVDVPPANGSTSYAFVSRTWGPSGSKYTVFGRCSA